MSLIILNSNELLVGVNRIVVQYNLETNVHELITLPEPLTDKKTLKEEPEIQNDDEDQINSTGNEILDIYSSPNGELIAVTTNSKELILFNNIDKKFVIKFHKKVARKSSAISFSPDLNVLLVSDKTGDCYLHDCTNVNLPGKWVLGHLSMVLDSLFSPDGKKIITCDRDEKIRVTCYPDTHIIQSYCLGHTEYISGINFLPHENDVLISVSGDEKVKFWQYVEGKQLHEIELSAAGYRLTSIKIDNNRSYIAIVLSTLDHLLIYEIIGKSDNLEMKLIHEYKLNEKVIFAIVFNTNKNLILSIVSDKGIVNIVTLLFVDLFKTEKNENKLNSILHECGELNVTPLSEVSLMFKKKFDNIKDYQERKRRRMKE